MIETKSNANQSLLHYLTQLIDTKFPELKGFLEELRPLIPASSVSFELISQEILEMSQNIDKITSLDITKQNDDDEYSKKIPPFMKEFTVRFSLVKERYTEMMSLVLDVIGYYGEEKPGEWKPEEFLSVFKIFMSSFEKATSESQKLKSRESLHQKRIQEREQKKLDTQNKQGSMDDLLTSLKKGTLPRKLNVHAVHTTRKVSTGKVGQMALDMLDQLKQTNVEEEKETSTNFEPKLSISLPMLTFGNGDEEEDEMDIMAFISEALSKKDMQE